MVYKDDLRKSMSAFDRYLLPVLPILINSDEYIRTEGSEEEIAKLLDQQIGIDVMLKYKEIFYGIGSRIQFGCNYKTFTIRCERETGHRTEFEKLKAAIKNGAMRPSYTTHAYVDNGRLLSLGCARTQDVIEWIDKNPKEIKTTYDEKGWQKFFVASWYKMRKDGYKVGIYDGIKGIVV